MFLRQFNDLQSCGYCGAKRIDDPLSGQPDNEQSAEDNDRISLWLYAAVGLVIILTIVIVVAVAVVLMSHCDTRYAVGCR
jgi:hypothetical protein